MSHLTSMVRRSGVRLAIGVGLALYLGSVSGCTLLGFIGALEDTRRRNSTHSVDAEYDGLAGKSFAVIVSADRFVQGQHPQIVAYITTQVSKRLAENAGASGWVPGEVILQYQYENPSWAAMSLGELAAEFGAERLVAIDLHEYRLNEPGNQFLWSAAASGTLSIIEADSAFPDEITFEKDIRVTFLDGKGFGPTEIGQQVVATEIARRFIERTSWTLYEHQEPYYPEY